MGREIFSPRRLSPPLTIKLNKNVLTYFKRYATILLYKKNTKGKNMKELRKKIKEVRNNIKLVTDKEKKGAGGIWTFVSLEALYRALNPLLDEYDLDIEIIDSFDEIGEYITISVIDLETDKRITSKMRLDSKPNINISLGNTSIDVVTGKQIKAIIGSGINRVQDREAQKTYLIRTSIISLFRLEIETVREASNEIRQGKETMEVANMLIRKIKLGGNTFVRQVEEYYGMPLGKLNISQLQVAYNRLQERRKSKKGGKNENK